MTNLPLQDYHLMGKFLQIYNKHKFQRAKTLEHFLLTPKTGGFARAKLQTVA